MMKKITLFLILFITSYNIIISQNKIYLKDTEMGKQKVNKTDSKVLLIFNVKKSRLLSDYQKLKIRNNFI